MSGGQWLSDKQNLVYFVKIAEAQYQEAQYQETSAVKGQPLSAATAHCVSGHGIRRLLLHQGVLHGGYNTCTVVTALPQS